MRTDLALLPPKVIFVDSPLCPPELDKALPVPAGIAIRSLVDPKTHGVAVRVRGQWVLRAHWDYRLCPGDVMEVHHFAAGDNDSRKVLRTVLTIVAIYFLGPGGLKLQGMQLALGAAAAQLAIGALLPPVVPPASIGSSPSPTYSIGLGGNQARMDEPIPVPYGRLTFAPPHAMQPYSEYENNDQYYHALFCIGMGYVRPYRTLLNKTLLTHFEDVRFNYLDPGVRPTLVATNVITSTEVSGQELDSDEYSPPIAVCRPRQLCSSLGIDILFPNGLGDASGSNMSMKSVTIRTEYQQIDDWGVAIDNWKIAGTEVISDDTSNPVRLSFRYFLPTPMRVQVRLLRTDAKSDNALILNSPQWGGLRGYLGGNEAVPFTIDTLDAGDQITAWITSEDIDEGGTRSFVKQTTARGNPSPSYAVIRDEGNGMPAYAAYAHRNFQVSVADTVTVTFDFMFNHGSVNNDWYPRREVQFGVQTTSSGSGVRVKLVDYDGKRGDPNGAFLSVVNAASWDVEGTQIGSVQLASKLPKLVQYTMEITLTRESALRASVVATVKQGSTVLGTIQVAGNFSRGDHCGFCGLSGPDAAGTVDGLPSGWVTYYDNIHVVATGTDFALRSLTNNATHLEIRMRASEQLNSLSQNQIFCDVARLLNTWNPTTGWSNDLVETRSPAWALADKWRNTEYGDGLPDSRMDLLGLYNLDLLCQARQDRFDYVFDSKTDSDSADQLIARSMRARVFRRNGIRAAWRDGAQNLPETGYGSRTMEPGSASIDYDLDVKNIPDGIVLEYKDHRSNDWMQIDCPAPGYTVREEDDPRYDDSKPSMERPEFVRIYGVQGATHAEREGLYEAAYRFYRRKKVAWSDELLGLRAAWGRPVIFAPALRGWQQAGDVAFWDSGSLTAGLSEQVEWVDGKQHYLSLMRPDGSIHDPIAVTPGASPWDVVLAEEPDFEISVADAERERTKYFLGSSEIYERVVIITDITPQEITDEGLLRVSLEGVVADDRVHEVDIHLLPSPGDDQDPFDFGDEIIDGDGGDDDEVEEPTGPIVNLTDISVDSTTFRNGCAIKFFNDGSIRTYKRTYTLTGDPPEPSLLSDELVAVVPNQWIHTNPVETSVAAQFEMRATPVTGLSAGLIGTFDTWLSLGTTREFAWYYFNDDGGVGQFNVQIREAATGFILTSHKVTFTKPWVNPGGK